MALTTYNFSTDYQDELLATMVRQPELFVGLDRVINYGYFTGVNSQTICKLMQDFQKQHSTYPTFAQLGTLANNEARKKGNTEMATELTAYIQKLSLLEVRSPKSYRDEAVVFARTRACIVAATDVVQTIQSNKELTFDIPKKFQEAILIGNDLNDQGYFAHNDEDIDFVIDKLTNEKYGIYTGFELLDSKVWKKGMGPGWLFVPLAPPKSYKTGFCLNMAVNMAGPQLGYDVLYYACEISSELALLRAWQRIANRSKDDFDENPEEFRTALKRSKETFLAGNLYVHHFPAGAASINDIRAHALQTVSANPENFKNLKAIFIDYMETVRYDGDKDAPEHRKQSSIYTQARALAEEFQCVVVMPDRCNRETVEQAVPNRNSFQGAIEKGGIVDVGIGLCQTPDERNDKIMRYYIFLNRHGEEGVHIQGKVEPGKMILTIDKQLTAVDTTRIEEKLAREKEDRRRQGRNRHQRAAGDSRLQEDAAEMERGNPRRGRPRHEDV